jgi:hypothetical protein
MFSYIFHLGSVRRADYVRERHEGGTERTREIRIRDDFGLVKALPGTGTVIEASLISLAVITLSVSVRDACANVHAAKR